MIISRTKNVWIKFITFINDMWKKIVFEVFSFTNKFMEKVRVIRRFGILKLRNRVTKPSFAK